MKVKARCRIVLLFGLVLALYLHMGQVAGQPTGVNEIQRGPSERGPTIAPVAVQAEAGNVTGLTINASRITNRWQGYFGNITGVIELANQDGNSLYDWQVIDPRGEIYASNSSETPVWSNIFCFNYSNNRSDGSAIIQAFNGSDLDNTLGIDDEDVDGVDETFNRTFSGSFQVGSITIDGDSGCSMVTLNTNSGAQETEFQEVLLTDNQSIIYTAILEQSQIGFQGSESDFQLIVGENGDVSDPTDYYFYVELT